MYTTNRHWKYYPALKILLQVCTGIVICRHIHPETHLTAMLLGLWLIALAVAAVCDARWIVIPLALTGITAGGLLYMVHTDGLPDSGYVPRLRGVDVVGRVCSQPVGRPPGRLQFVLECDSVCWRNQVVPYSGRKVLVQSDSAFPPGRVWPEYGDQLLITGDLQPLPEVRNPGAPDYGAQLRDHGICALISGVDAGSVFAYKTRDVTLPENLVLPVQDLARRFALENVGGEEGDIVRALLIGEQQYVDGDTRQAFARAGAVHILSVSGQHAALIILVVFVLTSWLPWRPVRWFVCTAVLLFYMLVAGQEPGIVRAVVTASAFTLARLTGRTDQPVNTLSLSALIQLAADPRLLFSMSFQLSFASVAGILLLALPLYQFLTKKIPSLKRYLPVRLALQSVLITLCIQLFVLPLTLHYFGYVPLISPLANIALLPAGAVAIGAAVTGTCFRALWPQAAGWYGGTAYLATHFMCAVAAWIASLTALTFAVPPVTLLQVLVLMCFVLYAAVAAHPAQAALRWFSAALGFVIVLAAGVATDRMQTEPKAVVYCLSVRGRLCPAVVTGQTLTGFVTRLKAADSVRDVASVYQPLAARLGLRRVRLIDPDSASPAQIHGILHPAGPAESGEYWLDALPVLLTKQRHARLALRPVAGRPVLQIPLGGTLHRAKVMAFNGRWEEIPWH